MAKFDTQPIDLALRDPELDPQRDPTESPIKDGDRWAIDLPTDDLDNQVIRMYYPTWAEAESAIRRHYQRLENPIDPLSAQIGSRLAEIRRDKSLSQGDVSERLGKSRSVYSRYESGEVQISLNDLPAMGAALEIHPAQLAVRLLQS